MSNKKQTAVEWLINKHFGGVENCTPDFRNKIYQAKELEKQQIIEAYENKVTEVLAEEYYTETYEERRNK